MPRSFVDLDLEPLNCVDGDVRLVNSNTSQEGRLQVCFNRVWGTVCNDRFDSDDARVVCSQLSTQFEGPSTQTSAGVFTVCHHLQEERCSQVPIRTVQGAVQFS